MILGFAGTKIVEAASIPVAPPTSFAQIQAELSRLNSQYGSDAQCGGWNTVESVAPDPPAKNLWPQGQRNSGTISWVEGAPGRRGIPLGNWDSGMAWRVETGDPNGDNLAMSGFVFPANATGLSTLCPANGGMGTFAVWCADGVGGNYGDPANPQLSGRDLDGDANARSCIKTIGLPSFANPPCTRQGECNNLCSEINSERYQYTDCKKTEEREFRDNNGNVVLDNNGDPITYFACVESGKKWACTGEWVDASVPGAATQCKPCSGAECRCPGPACDGKAPDPAIKDGKTWSSFFRRFTITSTRQGIVEVPGDMLTSAQMEANCYGFYEEYDPKKELSNLNCVIGNIRTRGNTPFNTQTLKQTQAGKGAIRASAAPDTLPNAREYDATKDQWYTRILGAFSFLKPQSPLTTGLLNPDTAKVIAGVERTIMQPFAKYSVLRSTDDTVINESAGARRLTEWWQNFSNGGNALFTPGTIRLRLPATWNESILPLAPVSVTQTGDSRLAPIDVQLEASDDLLGRIALYLQQTLRVDVREEHVPIIVPSNSPIELRAAAERWKNWSAERRASGLSVPGEVGSLITTLEQYAIDIERMRKLQNELPKVLAGMLDRQSDFLRGINDWAARNANTYASYSQQIQRRRDIEDQWKALLTEYGKFSDESNVPWCRNDRFTTPIYSLLDPWYPARTVTTYPENFSPGLPTCTQTSGTSLPTICLPLQEDLVLDFSILKISTGSVIVPVVKPVLVRLTVPLPGDPTDSAPNANTLRLPVLPAVPDLTAGFLLQLPPARQVSSPPDVVLPKEPNYAAVRAAIERATVIVRRMAETYKKFWDSFTYTPLQCAKGPLGPLDCCNTNDNRCQHSEMDLLERVTRFTARPAVLLKQDLQTQGVARVQLPAIRGTPAFGEGQIDPRKDATCLAQDHVCQTLLSERQLPKTGWQVQLPPSSSGMNALEDMRSRARAFTIGPNGQVLGNPPLPFLVPPERLTPTYEVPRAVPLTPKK